MRNGYDEAAAVAYARRWALLRNPAYLDFHGLGGDCTNFVSQCLYAGAGVMNRTPVYGWYYLTGNDRTASWTGVEYLYRFLTANKGPGPYAQEVGREDAVPGDVVQLGDAGGYTHAALIVDVRQGECYVAAHTLDSWMRPLSSYLPARAQVSAHSGRARQGIGPACAARRKYGKITRPRMRYAPIHTGKEERALCGEKTTLAETRSDRSF